MSEAPRPKIGPFSRHPRKWVELIPDNVKFSDARYVRRWWSRFAGDVAQYTGLVWLGTDTLRQVLFRWELDPCGLVSVERNITND